MRRPHRSKYHYPGRKNGKSSLNYSKSLEKHKDIYHPDAAWIKGVVRGHGGGYWLGNFYKPSRIIYIGSTKKIVVGWYNLKLYFKWLKRKLTGVYSPSRR